MMGKLRVILEAISLEAVAAWRACNPFSVSSFLLARRLKGAGVNPNTIIDVGANVGQFSAAVEYFLNPQLIISFEPLPDCFEKLEGRTAGKANRSSHRLALGECRGSVRFHVNSHRHSSSIFQMAEAHRKAFPGASEGETIDVPMTTLDDYLAHKELPGEILLKLDVQGYEARVLKGAANSLKRIRWILLETSFTPLYEGELDFEEIQELMSSLGYRFAAPLGWLESETEHKILQMDALFVRACP